MALKQKNNSSAIVFGMILVANGVLLAALGCGASDQPAPKASISANRPAGSGAASHMSQAARDAAIAGGAQLNPGK